MCFNAIRENKILAKMSEFTVVIVRTKIILGVLLHFSLSVKAAPHACVIMTNPS